MANTDKVLHIFTDDQAYVMRWMDSNGTRERRFADQSQLIEGLQKHIQTDGSDAYEIQPSDEVWPLVIQTLSK